MARREDFENSLWSDPDFLAVTPTARYVYIWTWTNPRCGMAGIYRFAPAAVVYELGLSEGEILSALEELSVARYAFYEDDVLWVRSRVKHLRQKTVQIARAIRNDLARIPRDHPLRAQFISTYGGLGWLSTELSGDPHEGPLTPAQAADSRSTVYGTGTGNGWKKREKGRAPEPQPYKPDPWAVMVRAEHFPAASVTAIEAAMFKLRCRQREVTVDAVREHLEAVA